MIKMKIKLPKINLGIKTTSWQKGVFITLLLGLLVYIVLLGYLFIKPVSPEVKDIIEKELSTSDIKFNQKTLESLQKRQQPSAPGQLPTGKNPFIPF